MRKFTLNKIHILVGLLVILPFLFIFSPLNIQTNMLSLLPKSKEQNIKDKAFEHIGKETAQKIIILFESDSKRKSYESAKYFYKNFKKNKEIVDIEFTIDKNIKNNIVDFYSNYRYQILSNNYEKLLLRGEGDKIHKFSLEEIFMPVTQNIAKDFVKDPFLLLNNYLLESTFLESPLFLYKDILISKHNNKYYAFSTITIDKNIPFAVNKLNDIVNNINETKAKTEKDIANTKLIISGIPIHSDTASQNSIKEINVISTISIMFILLLLYFNFKSIKPFFFALLSIAIGFYIALITTNFLFKEIHLLTMIFGTSLIGVSIDYSFHFFAEYFNKDAKNNDANNIIRRIFPGITFGLITSIIGYLTLIFTPFPGLQQIAVFSTIGLITSYLVVVILFPKFYKPSNLIYESYLLKFAQIFIRNFKNKIPIRTAYLILLLVFSFAIFGLSKLTINDDIRILYSSPKKLMDDEILTRKVLNQDKSFYFLLITAKKEQEVLEKELFAIKYLDKLIATNKISSYQAISKIIPTISQQKLHRDLIKLNLVEPHLGKQAIVLGLSEEQTNKIRKIVEQEPNYLRPSDILENKEFSKIAKILWVGKVDNLYSSIILLEGVEDPQYLTALDGPKYGVYLMNKAEDISNIFSKYREISISMLAIIFVAIFLILFFRYGFLHSIEIILPPFLASIFSLAMVALLGFEINLFNILALFLIIGIGIDYTIFYSEAKDHEATTSFAILMSTMTTLIAFGLLAFSGFAVLSSFGITILFGILLSYLLSPIAVLRRKYRN